MFTLSANYGGAFMDSMYVPVCPKKPLIGQWNIFWNFFIDCTRSLNFLLLIYPGKYVITECFPYCGTENKNNLMLYWHDNTQPYLHLNKTHEVLELYHQLVDNWYYWILNYYNLSTAQVPWSQKQWMFILPFI